MDNSILKKLIKSVIYEQMEADNEEPIAKTITAQDEYDAYLQRNIGLIFSPMEISVIGVLNPKPTEKQSNQIVFNSTDELSGVNKTTTIRKFKKPEGYVYIAFSTTRNPKDISNADTNPANANPLPTNPTDQQPAQPPKPEENKDKIILYISQQFQEKDGNSKIFSNFINKITNS